MQSQGKEVCGFLCVSEYARLALKKAVPLSVRVSPCICVCLDWRMRR